MDDPSAEIDKWRLAALAKSVSTLLLQRFGPEQFYTAEEVEAACDECRVPERLREYAVAMFVHPGDAEAVLQNRGSSKTAPELRSFLATQVFAISQAEVLLDALAIDFHRAADADGGTRDFGSFDDGCSGGGGDCDGGE